jgi:hypothetical protein
MRVMSVIGWSAALIGAALLTREAYIALGPRRQRRRSLYADAVARAQATGKALLVLGAPTQGIVAKVLGPVHGCGASCIDAAGCPTCAVGFAGRLEDLLPGMGTNSAVIFASDVLESVDDAAFVAAQMDRISGGDLFVATIEPSSLTAWVWPGTKRRILQAPPTAADVTYRPLPWKPEAAGAGGFHVVEMPRSAARLLGAPAGTAPPPLGTIIDTTGESTT